MRLPAPRRRGIRPPPAAPPAAACLALAAAVAVAVAVAVAAPAGEALADGQTHCRMSVSSSVHTVHYNGSARRNPDGTAYPGDAVNYLFMYEALQEGAGGPPRRACDSLLAGPVEASGRYAAATAHSVRGPSSGFDPSPHPSVHRGVAAEWLRTDHYFRSAWDGYDCRTLPYVRVYSCEKVGLRVDASPSFSVRSDGAMPRHERDLHDRWLRGGPNRGFEVRSTHDLHLLATASSPGGAPAGRAPSGLEDAASAGSFEAAVRAACSPLPAGAGCVFGRAEVEPRSAAGRECLRDIVAASMPRLLEAPPAGASSAAERGPLGPGAPSRADWEANSRLKRAVLAGAAWNASAPVADMTVDECIRTAERLSLGVSAVQVEHDPRHDHAHRAVRVERAAQAPVRIAEPDVSVAVARPPILDIDGHASANADGTYYEWDLPSVHVRPRVAFAAERHGTLSFAIAREGPPPAELPEVFTHACAGARPCGVAVGDGGRRIAETAVQSLPGDRLDVFRPEAGSVGTHDVQYTVVLRNIARPVEGTESVHRAPIRVVEYAPWYSAAFAYTALAGPGHTTLEKMHALALRYEGSLGMPGGGGVGGTEVHPGRRSKVSAADADLSYGAAWSGRAGYGAAGSSMSLHSGDGLADIARPPPPPPDAAPPAPGGEGAPVSSAAGPLGTTAVFEGAGIGRLLLAHDPPGPPPGWAEAAARAAGAAENAAPGPPAAPARLAAGAAAAAGGILLNATVESRAFGGRNATLLAAYEYAYPTAHVSAPLNVTAVQGPGGAGGPARGVHVEARLAAARSGADGGAGIGGMGNGSAAALPLASFMLDYLEGVAGLHSGGFSRGGNAGAGDPLSGTVTADASAARIEIDGTSYGLALVEPPPRASAAWPPPPPDRRAGGPAAGARAAADAAAREACPAGSAASYRVDGGTGDLFGVPHAAVECGGASLNGALISAGHARVRTAMCAHSAFALEAWAMRGCAPAMADALGLRLAGRPQGAAGGDGGDGGDGGGRGHGQARRPFPAAGFAAAYAGDMHDASSRAEGLGTAAGTAAASAVRILPGIDHMLRERPAGASLAARYGEAAALGSPPPYELIVTAGGNRTASVPAGPYPFSPPIAYEFAAGRADGGIALAPGSMPGTVRVSAADWFGRIAELRVDGAAVPPGAAGYGPPCRPNCEVRIGAHGGSGSGSIVTAVNAWGGTSSAAVPDAAPERGAPGAQAGPYGAAVEYAEAAVPYLAALCIAAACLSAYHRLAPSRRG